jgi:hypothetical protein
MLPFQAVVVVTRFVYILLLAILVYCQFKENRGLHVFALAASSVAVSFYASGGIFAAEIILLHALFFRRWRWLIASFIPLICYLALIDHYFHPSTESQTLKAMLSGMDLMTAGRIAFGTIVYYTTAFVAGWITPIGDGFGASELAVYAISFVVGAVTIIWAAIILLKLFWQTVKRQQNSEAYDVASCLFALISVWVFISAVSSSLLWVARGRILGASLGSSVHAAILGSTRYAAFSTLAFVIILFLALKMKRRVAGTILSLTVFVLMVAVGLNSMQERRLNERYFAQRNALEVAGTALLMGMHPADPEASAVWPGVIEDWYWPTELVKTADYVRSSGISYAFDMPSLGDVMARYSIAITDYGIVPVAQNPAICRLSGHAAPPKSQSFIAPQRFFAITDAQRRVVGFAWHQGTALVGHVLCTSADMGQPLSLSSKN